jgi:hypothetical protein
VAPSETAEAETPVAAAAPLFGPGERRAAWIGVAVAVVVFLLVATGGTPWHLFDRAGYTSDFYDVQARALAHGHLDVPPEVAGIEGFVIDGRTHLYFGVGPAIMRMPFTAWGDGLDGRLSALSQLVAVGVLAISSARLLARARRLVVGAPAGRPWWFAAGAAVPALATPVIFMASRPIVYHEAELWGAAAGLAGIDLVLRWHDTDRTRHLVEAMVFATFAMSVRPSTGAAPAVALGLFGLGALLQRHWRRAATLVVCAVVPLLGFVVVNYARFRSPFDVPFPQQVFSQFNAQRQAGLAANDGSLFGARFAPTNLVEYLSPTAIRFQRLFPFVGWGPKATVIGDVTFDTVDHSSSLTVGAPALVVLAAVGAWWTLRRDRGWTWRVVVVAAAAGTVSTFTIAYVAQRYLVDLVPLLVLLAAPAVWVWARAAAGWGPWVRRGSVAVMAVLVAVGSWTQMGLAMQARAFSINPTQQQLLEAARFQYDLDDALFGGAPPRVRAVEGAELPDASDGDLVILDGCGGLYRYDGYSWGTLERAAGGGRRLVLTGQVATAPQILASGDGWTITLVREGDDAVATYRAGDVELASEPFALPDGPVTLDVVADPATDEIAVALDGRVVLAASYLAATSGLTAGPGWSATAQPAAFCEELLARLGG